MSCKSGRLPGAILVAAACLASSCDTTPAVTRIEYTLVNLTDAAQRTMVQPGDLLLPGSTLRIQQVVLVHGENKRTELDGAPATHVRVAVEGGVFDSVTGEIRLAGEPAGTPPGGYGITITHAEGTASVTERYEADFARIMGPEPGEIAELDIELAWEEDGESHRLAAGATLIPGQTYVLHAEVLDVRGRTFSSGDGDYPVPFERLQTSADGFTASANGRLTANSDAGAYRIEVLYGGSGGHSTTLEFTYDEAIEKGPAPSAVSRLRITGELASESPIGPGERKPLDVEVRDSSGRIWRLAMEGSGSHREARLPPAAVPAGHSRGERHLPDPLAQRSIQRGRKGHARQAVRRNGGLPRRSGACGQQGLCRRTSPPEHRAADGGRRNRFHRPGGAARPGWPQRPAREPRKRRYP